MPTTATGHELQNRDHLAPLTDSQDLTAVLDGLTAEQLNAANVERGEVSALLVSADLCEVWAAETSRPYSLGARYTRIV